MITTPVFKSTPTYRNYDDYKYGEAYTQGWNDAMKFIFSEEEAQRKQAYIDNLREKYNAETLKELKEKQKETENEMQNNG